MTTIPAIEGGTLTIELEHHTAHAVPASFCDCDGLGWYYEINYATGAPLSYDNRHGPFASEAKATQEASAKRERYERSGVARRAFGFE